MRSFKDKEQDSDSPIISLMRVDILISSNMRILVQMQGKEDDTDYDIGIPKELAFKTENHIISFERYINPPFEVKAKLKQIKNRTRQKGDGDQQEYDSPWIITDIDLSGNIIVKSNNKD